MQIIFISKYLSLNYCLIVITNYFQDVSSWMVTNWKPLNKNSTFVNRSHYIIDCISKDLTANLDY